MARQDTSAPEALTAPPARATACTTPTRTGAGGQTTGRFTNRPYHLR